MAPIQAPELWPIIGNMHILFSFDFYHNLWTQIQKYSSPLRIKLFTYQAVLVDSPDDIRKLIGTKKSNIYQAVPYNNGLLSIKDEFWRPHRNFLLPSLSTIATNNFIPVFNKHSRKLINKLHEKVDGKEFCIRPFIGRSITCQTLETIIGIEADEKLTQDIFHDIERIIFRVGINMLVDFVLRPFVKIINLQKLTQQFNSSSACESIVNITLAKRRLENKSSSNLFIDRVIEMEKDKTIPNVNDMDHVVQMIGSGTDTSTVTVANILLLLAMHSKVQEKCYQEIKSIWVDSNLDIDLNMISQLTYVNMTIKECMRVIPTAPFVFKTSSKDLELDSGFIPANADILVSILTLHRRKDVWGENADQFDPDNFLPENEEKRSKFAYLPFSFGPRNCVGLKYAMTNIKIMLAYFLMNYKLSSSLTLEKLSFSVALTTIVKQGNLVRIEKR